jgi:hypothetical protein
MQLSGVWSIKHSKMYVNFFSIDNLFPYEMLYMPSFLQILHIVIPLNTSYSKWNTQFIALHKKAHNIRLASQRRNCPHLLPTICSVTSLEYWPSLKVLTFIFFKLFELIVEYLLYCKCFCMCNNHIPLYVRPRCLPLIIFHYM